MQMPGHIGGPYRVLSFQQFLPADPPGPDQKRKKHLVQLWTDPGGMRTLNVGCLRLKDPGKVAAGRAAAETRAANEAMARGEEDLLPA